MSEVHHSSHMVENVIPILRVESLFVSIDYYTRCLGFDVDWQDERMASVSRDGHGIMLCEGGQGQPGTWVWIGVKDVAQLYDELMAAGAIIESAPVNHPWAYEMHVADPDGHVLRFGSESLTA